VVEVLSSVVVAVLSGVVLGVLSGVDVGAESVEDEVVDVFWLSVFVLLGSKTCTSLVIVDVWLLYVASYLIV